MNEMLAELYEKFYEAPEFKETKEEIEEYHRRLIERLSKRDRRLVLRIIDRKDMIAEKLSYDSFVAGLRLGWKLSNALRGRESPRSTIAEEGR